MPWITLTPSHNSAGKFFFSRRGTIESSETSMEVCFCTSALNRQTTIATVDTSVTCVPETSSLYQKQFTNGRWVCLLYRIVHLSRVYEELEPRDPTHPINDGATDFKWKSKVASLNKWTCWCFAACQDLNSSKISPNSSGSGSWSLHHHYGSAASVWTFFHQYLAHSSGFFKEKTPRSARIFSWWLLVSICVFSQRQQRIWKRDFSFKVRIWILPHGG